jgi:starch phosphorylase
VKSIFKDFYAMYPAKFCNVTNGIAHRRWLCYSNPQLAELLDDCIGTGYRHNPIELNDFAKFADNKEVLERVRAIKHNNKVAFSNLIYKKTGKLIDTHSMFDVHIKRLHEYKRQLLNVLNIISLYLDIKDNPNADFQPQTFLFAAKAAPGYYHAKTIIRLIYCLGKEIENDPVVNKKLAVAFLEDYNVSLAEALVPAAEISEQISMAGKEASGTGCRKLMMNGAMTIGTLDGANVEMLAAAGKDNMYIFGLTSAEVDDIWLRGYNCNEYYIGNEKLKRIIAALNAGFAGESFAEIANYLVSGPGIADPYMCLADFESYRLTHANAVLDYQNKEKWNRMSLLNIAACGYFAADRSIDEYAKNIWNLRKVTK